MHGYVPLNNLILALPIKVDEVSKGGIFIPEQARKTLNEATVHLTGPMVSAGIAPGDTIVFAEHSETRIKLEGEIYVCVEESNVMLHRKPQIAALQQEKEFCNCGAGDNMPISAHHVHCSLRSVGES